MNENKISYLNRTFDDYKKSLKNYLLQYYPQIAESLNDASIGSWIVDMVASIGDNLSYYIDKAYNETNLDSSSFLLCTIWPGVTDLRFPDRKARLPYVNFPASFL